MGCDNVKLYKRLPYHRSMSTGQCVCTSGYYDDHINYNCSYCRDYNNRCQTCTNNLVAGTTNVYKYACTFCVGGNSNTNNNGYILKGGECKKC